MAQNFLNDLTLLSFFANLKHHLQYKNLVTILNTLLAYLLKIHDSYLLSNISYDTWNIFSTVFHITLRNGLQYAVIAYFQKKHSQQTSKRHALTGMNM